MKSGFLNSVKKLGQPLNNSSPMNTIRRTANVVDDVVHNIRPNDRYNYVGSEEIAKLNLKVIPSNLNRDNMDSMGFVPISKSINQFDGIVITKNSNMIIENNNKNIHENNYNTYVALSYVSSGDNNGNLEMKMMIDGKLTPVNARHSNDRLKYVAAMEYVGNTKLVWTDHISTMKHYTSQMLRMRAIGRAYQLAEKTIVILDEDDAKIMKKICKSIDIVQKSYDEANPPLPTSHINMNKNTLYSYNIIKELDSIGTEIVHMFKSRGEYSYWSRIWTLQEQHMSPTLEYGELAKNKESDNIVFKFNSICNTKDMLDKVRCVEMMLRAVLRRGNNVDGVDRSDTSVQRCMDLVNVYHYILSGQEQSDLSGDIDSKYLSMDDILLQTLATNNRCASSAIEMNEAISIAMGIYDDNIISRRDMIWRKFIDHGYIPIKRFYSETGKNLGWEPGNVCISSQGNKVTGNVYSITYTQFIKVARECNAKAIMNDGKNSIAIKSYEISITILSSEIHEHAIKVVENVYLTKSEQNKAYNISYKANEVEDAIKGVAVMYRKPVVGEVLSVGIIGMEMVIYSRVGDAICGYISLIPSIVEVLKRSLKGYSSLKYRILSKNVLSYDMPETKTNIEERLY